MSPFGDSLGQLLEYWSGTDTDGFTADEEVIPGLGTLSESGVHRIINEKELAFSPIDDLSQRERAKIDSLLEWLKPDEKELVRAAYYGSQNPSQ